MILYVYLIRKKFIRGIVSLIEFFFLSCAVVYLPLSYALQFITVSDYQLKYTIPVSVVVIGIERVIACATADVNAKIAECISPLRIS